jgi:hypothetical protein
MGPALLTTRRNAYCCVSCGSAAAFLCKNVKHGCLYGKHALHLLKTWYAGTISLSARAEKMGLDPSGVLRPFYGQANGFRERL